MENCGSNGAKREREVMPKSMFLVVLGIMSNVARRPDNLSKKSDKELCAIRNKKPCDNEYILRDEGYTSWQLIALDILRSRYPLVEFNNEKLREAVKLYKQDTIKAEEQYGPIACWDVSSVTDMVGMFFECTKFNSDLSQWDVSSVTDMEGMFYGCESFNSDLSQWDVSSVKSMYYMFEGCTLFNADLSEWDVSSVTIMGLMFCDCESMKKMNKLPKWYKQ